MTEASLAPGGAASYLHAMTLILKLTPALLVLSATLALVVLGAHSSLYA